MTEKVFITQNEYNIILDIRMLESHERIEIIADQWGRPDYYIVNARKKKILQKSEKMEATLDKVA